MPRPPVKRRRANSFTSRRKANIPDQSQARQALEHKLSTKTVGKRPHDSDDSDELVTTRAIGRARKNQEIYASGAVAKGDQPGSYPTRAQTRKTMRENTDEILSQRSRSASRTTTPTPGSDKESEPKKRILQSGLASSAKQRGGGDTTAGVVKGDPSVLRREVSVLGNIKPRKRQASILQLIENDPNNNSSILNSDDEDHFLPDASSTPAVTTKLAPSPVTNGMTGSLKRKRGADIVPPSSTLGPSAQKIRKDVDRLPRRSSSPEIPPPSRTQRRKLSRPSAKNVDDDAIMAMPESSDEEDGIEEQAIRPSSMSKIVSERPVPMSTLQLQSLMPSKKHNTARPQRRKNEYDVPPDSASDVEELEEIEHSSFVPSQSRAVTRKANATRRDKTKGKVKEPQKSTNTIPYTPSPVRIRTPLPLSSTRSGRTQAKSPSKQGTAMQNRSINTPIAAATRSKGTRNQYGGSRQRATGKENEVPSLSEGPPFDTENMTAATTRGTKARPGSAAPGIKAWNRKWADIDDFKLEFEDVAASAKSSSPLVG